MLQKLKNACFVGMLEVKAFQMSSMGSILNASMSKRSERSNKTMKTTQKRSFFNLFSEDNFQVTKWSTFLKLIHNVPIMPFTIKFIKCLLNKKKTYFLSLIYWFIEVFSL